MVLMKIRCSSGVPNNAPEDISSITGSSLVSNRIGKKIVNRMTNKTENTVIILGEPIT
jgi:hypothetical protein